MARYARAGSEVVLCNATNGDLGGVDLSREELSRLRRGESERSAAVIGAEYRCLEFPDCGLDGSSMEARERFIDLIRSTKPDVVFTHHPNDYHVDHTATGKLTFEATFMACISLLSTAVQSTDKILPVFYMDTLAGIRFEPEQYVDVTDTFHAKQEMLAMHESQVKWMKLHDNIDLPAFMETMTEFRGLQSGVNYAEGFVPAHAWLRDRCVRMLP